MSVSVSYRSIDSMHPAQAFEIVQRVEALAIRFDSFASGSPNFRHEKDGFLAGSFDACFDDDDFDGQQHSLLDLLQLCQTLSTEFSVDWEFSHDYEIDSIGRIVEGTINDCLIEEIESIIQIGNLFGDIAMEEEFGDDDQWEPKENQFGIWRQSVQIAAATTQEEDEPYVIKFPGVE